MSIAPSNELITIEPQGIYISPTDYDETLDFLIGKTRRKRKRPKIKPVVPVEPKLPEPIPYAPEIEPIEPEPFTLPMDEVVEEIEGLGEKRVRRRPKRIRRVKRPRRRIIKKPRIKRPKPKIRKDWKYWLRRVAKGLE